MFALLWLAACVTPELADADPHASVRADTAGTLRSIEAVADTIRGLPDDARAEAAASLRTLSVSDPFTRAALQLPFALNALVAHIPAEAFDPRAQPDWRALQQGLVTHVAALGALGVDLPVPRPGDPLYGADVPLLDREALLATDDPLAATQALIDEIIPIARRIDGPTRARIEAASERVEAVTGLVRPCPREPTAVMPGQPWTLGMQLGGWHDALRRARPFALDAATEEELQGMIEVLDRYGDASWVSTYAIEG